MKHTLYCVWHDGSDAAAALYDVTTDRRFDASQHSVQTAIRRAVTRWATTTEEGKNAYANSSEDFNWGDLASYIDDATLEPFLTQEGVTYVEHLWSGCGTYVDHDENLVEELLLDDKEDK